MRILLPPSKAFKDAEAFRPCDESKHWIIRYNETKLGNDIHTKLEGLGENSFGRQALASYAQFLDEVSLSTSHRFICADASAKLAHGFRRLSEASRYQAKALQLLLEFLTAATTRAELLKTVRTFRQLAGNAAALTGAAAEPVSTAIQRLEFGRIFLWDRLLVQTTPVDDLAAVDEDLAAEFKLARLTLRRQWDLPSRRLAALTSSNDTMIGEVSRLENEANWNHYQGIMEKMRGKPHFKSFLRHGEVQADLLKRPADLQQQAADLQEQAVEAPIVYVNASQHRSDALVVTQHREYSVHLPKFSFRDIADRGVEMSWVRIALALRERRELAVAKFEESMCWPWEAVAKPVLDSIEFPSYTPGRTDMRRVVWVTTPWLVMSPIHAAGNYEGSTTPDMPSCVHGWVVSTYTISLKALRYARRRRDRHQAGQLPQRMVPFTMESTPCRSRQPMAITEAETIASHLNTLGVMCKILLKPDVSLAQAKLQKVGHAFFAVHAEADWNDPSESAILVGSPRAPTAHRLTVNAVLDVKMDDCRLVYIPSCVIWDDARPGIE